jgi:hypothetical protein
MQIGKYLVAYLLREREREREAISEPETRKKYIYILFKLIRVKRRTANFGPLHLDCLNRTLVKNSTNLNPHFILSSVPSTQRRWLVTHYEQGRFTVCNTHFANNKKDNNNRYNPMGTKKGKEPNIWQLNLKWLVAPDAAALHLSWENHFFPLQPNCRDPKQTRSMCLYGLKTECTIMYISLQIKKTGKEIEGK